MDVRTVSTRDRTLLGALHGALEGADEALLCVAFVQSWGVAELKPDLKRLGGRARLLATTSFGSSDPAALYEAARCGTRIGVLNPPRGTYHPKLYVATRGDACTAVIGSANLTRGLLLNEEAAVVLEGRRDDPALADALAYAEWLWARDERADWQTPAERPAALETIEPELWAAITEAGLGPGAVVQTLRSGAPNRIERLRPDALFVSTRKSDAEGARSQEIPAWMLNTAWEALRIRGTLTNRELLGELRVHRSSFVLALFAQLPGVEPVPGAVAVRWRGRGAASKAGGVVVPFPRPAPPVRTSVPLVPLKVAASPFGLPAALAGSEGGTEQVRPMTTRPLVEGMFVAQVAGASMEPAVPDGAYALFRRHEGGEPAANAIVVVSLREVQGPDEAAWTLKRWRRVSEGEVRLVPENPAFSEVVLGPEALREARVVADLVEVLGMERPPFAE